MGLCKCPKRKPSNLFCFEHRVNVCDHCLVTHHPKCIVQTYVKWLQDDDYQPICQLCNGNLSEGQVARLECFDLFHVSCLDRFASSFPPTTAPAGYQCPMCKSPIIPPPNHAGPVVDALRPLLAKMKWARAGLGLGADEYIPDDNIVGTFDASTHQQDLSYERHTTAGPGNEVIDMTMDKIEDRAVARRFYEGTAGGLTSSTQVHRSESGHSASVPLLADTDEGKYERRSASQWLSRVIRSSLHKPAAPSRHRRMVMVVILGGLGILTFLIIMSQLGRHSTETDPLLDPLANPNIRVVNS